MQSILLNDVIFFDCTLSEVVFYLFNVTALLTVLSVLVYSYFYLRPKLPSRVNCWFCNHNFWVPYESRNAFDCRFCDQYNGFTADGDYNTNILLRKKTASSEVKVAEREASNGLCKSCNLNQQLKVQQLSNFVPMNDANYEEEVEHFKNQLEKSYKLCDQCTVVLTQTLQTQNYELLKKRLNGYCPDGSPRLPKYVQIRYQARKGFLVASFACLVALLLTNIYQLLVDFELIAAYFMMQEYGFLISASGAALNLLSSIIDKQITSKTFLLFALWGAINGFILMKDLLLVLLASILLLIAYLWPDSVEMKKLPVVKAQPVPEVIPQPVQNHKELPKTKPPACESPKKAPKPKKVNLTPPRMETRSQAAKKVEAEPKRTRLLSPLPEMLNRFGGLRLSSPEPERPVSAESTATARKQPAREFIKPATLLVGEKGAGKSTLPAKNYFSPNDAVPDADINLCSYPYAPYHVAYDYGPGFLTPVTHTSHTFSFSGSPSYPYGFPHARFSPSFGTLSIDSNNSTPTQNVLNSGGRSDPAWDWIKISLAVGSVALNLILVPFFVYQLLGR